MEKGAALCILFFFFYNSSKKTGKHIEFKVYTCTIYAADMSLAACVVFANRGDDIRSISMNGRPAVWRPLVLCECLPCMGKSDGRKASTAPTRCFPRFVSSSARHLRLVSISLGKTWYVAYHRMLPLFSKVLREHLLPRILGGV